jgi:hypothetical protein
MTRARDVANIDGLLTTTGDTYYASAAGTPARLGIGTTGQVLNVSGGVPAWSTPSSGAVVQVKSATYSTATTNSSTSYADTGLSLAITPTSASNKVLVIVSQQVSIGASTSDKEAGLKYKLQQNGSDIFSDDLFQFTTISSLANSTEIGSWQRANLTFLASPATTSAVTYKTQFANIVGGTGRLVTAQNSSGGTTRTSTITLMEVTP